MENETNPVLKLIAGIVLVLVIIGVIFGIVMFATNKAESLTTEIDNTVNTMMETKYTKYDGEVSSGNTVLNLIKTSYSTGDTIYIKVSTLSDTAGKTYVCDASLSLLTEANQATLVKNAKDKTKNEYINPAGNFAGKVVKNSNGAIIGIEFTQQ